MSDLSVTVMPLEPPFRGTVHLFSFEGWEKQLAVSDDDGRAIANLLAGNAEGRRVVLEAVDEGPMIRISVLQ